MRKKLLFLWAAHCIQSQFRRSWQQVTKHLFLGHFCGLIFSFRHMFVLGIQLLLLSPARGCVVSVVFQKIPKSLSLLLGEFPFLLGNPGLIPHMESLVMRTTLSVHSTTC